MRTQAKVGIALAVAAAAGVIGYYGYERNKCSKAGGTFGFPFGPCITINPDPTCPTGQVWNGTECVEQSNTLTAPTNLQINFGTPTSEIVNCTASWNAVSGASYYVLTVNGQSYQVNGTQYNFTANAGTTISVSVSACNN